MTRISLLPGRARNFLSNYCFFGGGGGRREEGGNHMVFKRNGGEKNQSSPTENKGEGTKEN